MAVFDGYHVTIDKCCHLVMCSHLLKAEQITSVLENVYGVLDISNVHKMVNNSNIVIICKWYVAMISNYIYIYIYIYINDMLLKYVTKQHDPTYLVSSNATCQMQNLSDLARVSHPALEVFDFSPYQLRPKCHQRQENYTDNINYIE